jgi:hypothetical protein
MQCCQVLSIFSLVNGFNKCFDGYFVGLEFRVADKLCATRNFHEPTFHLHNGFDGGGTEEFHQLIFRTFIDAAQRLFSSPTAAYLNMSDLLGAPIFPISSPRIEIRWSKKSLKSPGPMKIFDGFIVDVRRDNYLVGRLLAASFLHRPSAGEFGNTSAPSSRSSSPPPTFHSTRPARRRAPHIGRRRSTASSLGWGSMPSRPP